jgi:hypothetical protein
MQQVILWILASLSLAFLVGAVALRVWRLRKPEQQPLPTEWTLTPRPVFSVDERRVYRQLREALPHHVVLSKLPLVRFCQPTDPQEVGFWYELLGASHVTFAVCSANGRVLAAVDLDTDRSASRRTAQIKQSVLSACKVRFLRCPAEHLPSIAELQMLVPQTISRGPQPAPAVHQARDALASTVAMRRRERTALWQDSSFMQDSFFGVDGRVDVTASNSEFGALRAALTVREIPLQDVGGVAVVAPVPLPVLVDTVPAPTPHH